MANSNNSNGGIGIAGVFLIIFVCAKLFAWQPIASWSWLWVLSPMWIPLALIFAVIAVVMVVSLFSN